MIDIPFLTKFINGRRNKSQTSCLTDVVDRLHYIYTVALLALFAVMVGCKQYGGSPIDCFIAAENTKASGWEDFILAFCYVQSTSSFDMESNNQTAQGSMSFSYYQYVPLFLGFQALCFVLPHFMWEWFQSLLYIDMSRIVTEAEKLSKETDTSGHEKVVDHISQHIFNYFNYRRIARRSVFSCLLHQPYSCTILYLLTKLFALFNVIIQFLITNIFLGSDWLWSVHTISRMTGISNDTATDNSYFFPLIVQCTYPLPAGLKNNVHTSQCLLAVNYLNEKLFLVILIWFAVLIMISVVNVFGLISLLVNTRRSADLHHFVQTYCMDSSKLHSFFTTFWFLNADGSLLVRFLRAEAGSAVTGSVLSKVFELYCEEKGFVMPVRSRESWSSHYTALPIDGAGDSEYPEVTDHQFSE